MQAAARGKPMTAPIVTAALGNMLLLLLWLFRGLDAGKPAQGVCGCGPVCTACCF
jgi:hypothetical protein